MRDCIIPFDERLSQKYNKSAMFEFQDSLEEKFMTQDDKSYFDE